MEIDVWDVIDAASTKPFGYMPFYPGPGLGGHCIPVDPFYLTYKAREYGITTKFIELAGEINTSMPFFVVSKISKALNDSANKSVKNSKIILVGLSYKKDIDDTRETPSLVIMKELIKRGASVDYHDPFVHKIGIMRDHIDLKGKRSVKLTKETIKSYDLIVICTNHSNLNLKLIAKNAKIIVDTRNCMSEFEIEGHLFKA